ncbi:MAG: glycosyltransferase family 2 protein [Culicoidibacterales bacterium]
MKINEKSDKVSDLIFKERVSGIPEKMIVFLDDEYNVFNSIKTEKKILIKIERGSRMIEEINYFIEAYNISNSSLFFVTNLLDEIILGLIDRYFNSTAIVTFPIIFDVPKIEKKLSKYSIRDSNVRIIQNKKNSFSPSLARGKSNFQFFCKEDNSDVSNIILSVIENINIYNYEFVNTDSLPKNITTCEESVARLYPYIELDFSVKISKFKKSVFFRKNFNRLKEITIFSEWLEKKQFHKVYYDSKECSDNNLHLEFYFKKSKCDLDTIFSLLLSVPPIEKISLIKNDIKKYFSIISNIMVLLENDFYHEFTKLKLYYCTNQINEETFIAVYNNVKKVVEDELELTAQHEAFLVNYIRSMTVSEAPISVKTVIGYKSPKMDTINAIVLELLNAQKDNEIATKNKCSREQIIKQITADFSMNFSIIMVSYNRRRTIFDAIDSFIHNNYRKSELIIVDNNSSGKLYDELLLYTEEQENIIVIKNNENNYGGARNFGLEVARGEYISFLDDDDRISSSYFSVLEKHTIKYKYDILRFNAIHFDEERNIEGTISYSVVGNESHYDIEKEDVEILLDHRENMASACFQCFRRDLLAENRFLLNVFFEDNAFYLNLLLRTNSIKYLAEGIYFRTIHTESLMSKKGDIERRKITELSVYAVVCDMIISINSASLVNKSVAINYVEKWGANNINNLNLSKDRFLEFVDEIKSLNSLNYMEVIKNVEIKTILKQRFSGDN